MKSSCPYSSEIMWHHPWPSMIFESTMIWSFIHVNVVGCFQFSNAFQNIWIWLHLFNSTTFNYYLNSSTNTTNKKYDHLQCITFKHKFEYSHVNANTFFLEYWSTPQSMRLSLVAAERPVPYPRGTQRAWLRNGLAVSAGYAKMVPLKPVNVFWRAGTPTWW